MKICTARYEHLGQAVMGGVCECRSTRSRAVKKLEEQLAQERERANRAVDAQLAVRGFPTVTPRQGMPDLPDVLEEDPEQVAAVEARMAKGDATVFMERR